MTPVDWDWGRIVEIRVADGSLHAVFGPSAWLLLPVGILLWLLRKRPWRSWFRQWNPVRFHLPLIEFECDISPNHATAQIAHQAYVELVTRKAALPFDEEHDAVSEIYDSWYALFGELRRLARTIPARAVRNDDGVCSLLDLLRDVMNKGLRPHLTRWQGPYRNWYRDQRTRDGLTPESTLQRLFPRYAELVSSLKETHGMLADLTDQLAELAHGKNR